MKYLRLHLVLLALAAVLGGCASKAQQPLELDNALWNERDEVIGIAYVEPPRPFVSMVGNQGLLDLAFNNSMAAGLKRKVDTWDVASFRDVPKQIAEELNSRGYNARVIEQPVLPAQLPRHKAGLGYAGQDYRALKQQHQIDKLVLVSLSQVGTVRSYYSMIPTSDPVAQIGGLAQVIDLDDNRLLHYQPIAASRAAEGEWDEGPDFPNLTNAFYQLLDSTEQQMISPFRRPLISAQHP
ncbi:hypothetical protein [Pseudomonas mangrovi]|uniref:Uncharacterized protein n=1 Tax=Pseudomonas mangrovi TaxID=2161748 RepID=A0A2T5PAS3_9PSED|nr:hypothetical protein [Pseudomonas mangrovi]PTU74843.1 hypothetical protein DBO85_08040 [Pseudomonas mangrovi]